MPFSPQGPRFSITLEPGRTPYNKVPLPNPVRGFASVAEGGLRHGTWRQQVDPCGAAALLGGSAIAMTSDVQDDDNQERKRPRPTAEREDLPHTGEWIGFNLEAFDYQPFLEGVSRITLGHEVEETGQPIRPTSAPADTSEVGIVEREMPGRGPVLKLLGVHGRNFLVGLSECGVSDWEDRPDAPDDIDSDDEPSR